MRAFVVAVVVAVIGCGSGSGSGAGSRSGSGAETETETGSGAETETGSGAEMETETETETETVACPPEGAPAPDCSSAPALRCEYPGLTCWCGQPRTCSGVPPRPAPPAWTCEAPQPPMPEAGSACETEGDRRAPWCCGVGVVCQGGTWQPTPFPCPP